MPISMSCVFFAPVLTVDADEFELQQSIIFIFSLNRWFIRPYANRIWNMIIVWVTKNATGRTCKSQLLRICGALNLGSK